MKVSFSLLRLSKRQHNINTWIHFFNRSNKELYCLFIFIIFILPNSGNHAFIYSLNFVLKRKTPSLFAKNIQKQRLNRIAIPDKGQQVAVFLKVSKPD